MTKLFSLKTLVVVSSVSIFISACGTQPSNINQTGLNNSKTYGFTTLAQTNNEAKAREEYYKAHATPVPTSIIKKVESPKPTVTPLPVVRKEDNKNPQIIRIETPKATPTPVKVIESVKPITAAEAKAREEYYRAHAIPTPNPTPVVKKVEQPKVTEPKIEVRK